MSSGGGGSRLILLEKPSPCSPASYQRSSFSCLRLAFALTFRTLQWWAFGEDRRVRVESLMEKREPLTPDKFATVKQKGILEDHGEPIFALAFSPDAKLLVSGSRDNTVKFCVVNTY